MRKSILGWSARIDAAALRTEASDRPKVERLQLQEGVRELAADRRDGRLRLGLVAGRHHNLAAPAGQFPGHLQPELTVGAGHHRDPARLIGDVRGGPGHTRCYAGGWCKRVGCSCSGCRRAGQGCSKQHEQAGATQAAWPRGRRPARSPVAAPRARALGSSGRPPLDPQGGPADPRRRGRRRRCRTPKGQGGSRTRRWLPVLLHQGQPSLKEADHLGLLAGLGHQTNKQPHRDHLGLPSTNVRPPPGTTASRASYCAMGADRRPAAHGRACQPSAAGAMQAELDNRWLDWCSAAYLWDRKRRRSDRRDGAASSTSPVRWARGSATEPEEVPLGVGGRHGGRPLVGDRGLAVPAQPPK